MKVFVTGGSGFLGRNLIGALVRRGDSVVALSRSERSDAMLRGLGAEPVRGDLDATEAMAAGMRGCQVVFHAAASTEEWAPEAVFFRANVDGTENVLEASRRAGVRRFVHVGTEAALLTGAALIDVDETHPLPKNVLPGYPRTKQEAEKRVVAANGKGGLETVVIRPRLIWGAGDTSLLPKFIGAIQEGRWMWLDGGKALTSTCHVDNVCEGAILAAEKGRPGEVYFLTDGASRSVRTFFTDLLGTQGVVPPEKKLPAWIAWAAASITEPLWTVLGMKKPPPAMKVAVTLFGRQVTVSDAKARRELGYVGKVSYEEGLAKMRAAKAAASA